MIDLVETLFGDGGLRLRLGHLGEHTEDEGDAPEPRCKEPARQARRRP